MDNSEQAKLLISKYLAGKATEEEKILVERFYLDQFGQQGLPENAAGTEGLKSEIWEAVEQRIKSKPIRVIRLWPRIAAAASILLCCSVGLYFYHYKAQQPPPNTQLTKNDIAPGSNKAILKLANGKQLIITNAKNGLLAQQGNTTITKIADGELVYNSSGEANGAILYDTLIVPRGGQHQVKFADGSIAYLNADTKLRIPQNFEKSNRTVELISGEALFHVVHNSKMPFRVKVRGQVTQDIGTEFNINAYTDEPVIKTTLVEGSVKVSKNDQSVILKAGQQAIVQEASKEIEVDKADTEEVIAWKNGDFIFKSGDFKTAMRQVARWYNVDVVYDSSAPNNFVPGGWVSRSKNISAILNIMESTGKIHFKVEGRRVTVTK